jgi:hypothetical protein
MSLHLSFLRDAFIKRRVFYVYVYVYEFDFVTAINHESCRGSNLRARPIVVGYRIAGGIPEEIDLRRRREARRSDCFLSENSFPNTVSLSFSFSPSLSSLSISLALFFFLVPLPRYTKLSCENGARRDR